jgi:hypothetical protein
LSASLAASGVTRIEPGSASNSLARHKVFRRRALCDGVNDPV